LAFCYATGNAGTGMCLQGAVEYGYEFAPVAGIINLFARMNAVLQLHYYFTPYINVRCNYFTNFAEI